MNAFASEELKRLLVLYLPGRVTLELIYCPPGIFMMGSPTSELGRDNDEILHLVTLTEGFYLGKYPLTEQQYRAICGHNSLGFRGQERCPVETINWYESLDFCEKFNTLLAPQLPRGWKISLPTEAQWEYACRAGTSTSLNSNQELLSFDDFCPILDELAWYSANSGYHSHPVGQKRPNAWGFYDMHGNVWEWCIDHYGTYRGHNIDPRGSLVGTKCVRRGGSWFRKARCCRSAFRSRCVPDAHGKNPQGLRLALVNSLRPVT